MVCMDNPDALKQQQQVTGFLFSNSDTAKQVRPDTSRQDPTRAIAQLTVAIIRH